MGTLTDERSRGRIEALDGLRGYAAATVVVYHGILSCSPHTYDVLYESLLQQGGRTDQVLKLVLSVINGELAVGLFFAMSGMVLFRALARMDANRPVFGLGWRFLLRRLLRLWPVMAVCLVVYTLVLQAANAVRPGFTDLHTIAELADNLVLTNPVVIGATWTIAVELAAAPWIFVSYLCVRRWGVLRSLPLFAAGIIALRYTGALYHPTGFLIGLPLMLAGAVLEAMAVRGLLGRLFWQFALPVGAAIAFGDEMFVSWHSKLHAVLLVTGAPLIVGGVAAAASVRLNRFLEGPHSRFLGRISYSLYLWNTLMLLMLVGLVGRARTEAAPLEIGLAIGLVALLATIPIADLSQRWLEQPSIRLGRALTRTSGAGRPQTPASVLVSRS